MKKDEFWYRLQHDEPWKQYAKYKAVIKDHIMYDPFI